MHLSSRIILFPLTLIACTLLSGCGANYNGTGQQGAVKRGQTVTIKATSEDRDEGIRNAISSELARRGVRVTNSETSSAHTLSYYDEWKWDIVMYLWSLDLKLEDTTGKPLATADFSHFGFHHFPNNRNVVTKLFEKWDAAGVFSK